MRTLFRLAGASLLLAACTTSNTPDASPDVANTADTALPDATLDAAAPDAVAPDAVVADVAPDAGPADVQVVRYDGGMSNIRHVVVVWQENHTFDTYFGRYCTAAAGSNPSCTAGPACCERAPDTEPSGASPVVLDDVANGLYDPPHGAGCELAEMHGGRMDRYVTGSLCAAEGNFALVPETGAATYRGYATHGALADRYFQPIAGATSSNDMYLAVAREVFLDNAYGPQDAPGSACAAYSETMRFTGPTVGDLLLDAGHTFSVYAEGIGAARTAGNGCAPTPTECPAHVGAYPCIFDPGDIPFLYYDRFVSSATLVQDTSSFFTDLAANHLPEVSYYKAVGYRTEHPGGGTTISAGMASVDRVVQAIAASPYANDTLILVTWDEGGGYFDHVAPPPTSTVDGQQYGTRVPLLAIGRFARANTVSHVTMEHSSIVRFLEWNFLGATGLLGARDGVVNNIGSMLDPAQTGVAVPEQ